VSASSRRLSLEEGASLAIHDRLAFILRLVVDLLDELQVLVRHRKALAILKGFGVRHILYLAVILQHDLANRLNVGPKELLSRIRLVDLLSK
jgi:hypothetical protein